MGIVRSEVSARIPAAVKRGLSASAFIRQMRAKGLGYRRTTMLADYRAISGIQSKVAGIRSVRRGYVPAEHTVIVKDWARGKGEYMYKVRTLTTKYPGAPVEERYINISQDKPLTIEAIEQEAWSRSFEQSPPLPGEERQFIVEAAIRKGL